tara:strand:- start:480 stop:1319 length:840 start_codon:yes stop_codon:yes gene_type:complete
MKLERPTYQKPLSMTGLGGGATSLIIVGATGNDPNNPTQSDTLTGSQEFWTAPAGITAVRLTLTGGTFTSGGGFTNSQNGSHTVGLRLQYSSSTAPSLNSVYAAFNSWASTYNSTLTSSSGNRYISRPLTINYTLDNGDTVQVYEQSGIFGGGSSSFNSGSAYITGSFVWYPGGSPYFNPTILQYTHYTSSKQWASGVWLSGIEYYVPLANVAAPSASMFGYTAAGKTTGTANTVGPIIVSVNPGQTYQFNGGTTYLSSGQYAHPYSFGSTNATAFIEY